MSSAVDIATSLRARGLLPVADDVCARRGVTVAELCGRRRSRAVSHARHELWAQLREQRGYSYPELAALFDRDHTTVMFGVRAHRLRTRSPDPSPVASSPHR